MIDSVVIRFLNTSGVFLLVLGALVYLWWIEKEQREALRVLFSVLAAGLVVILLKELFLVPRPFEVERADPLAGLTVLSGFPSFHSALAFSVATTVAFRRRGVGILMMLLALMVGVGRVLANVHYPMDVMVGVIIGVVIATTIHEVRFQLREKIRPEP